MCAGVLLGIAIRTGSPLSLYLAEPVWKQLAGMNLTIADLSEVRLLYELHTNMHKQIQPEVGALLLTEQRSK